MGTCGLCGDPKKWEAIVHRPLPQWYADMKLGIFIHWGSYSVPSYGSEWFWHNYQCTGGGDPGNPAPPTSVKGM